MKRAIVCIGLFSLLGLPGCDDGTSAPTDCAAGSTRCEGRCVDTQSDEANCGDCGLACPAGQLCSAGTCAAFCSPGFLLCGEACVDPLTHPRHCGASGDCAGANAGTACAEGESCGNGLCAIACPAGQLECGGRCVDPLADRTYCGATDSCTGAEAGATCAAGEVCGNGLCAISCPAGLLECDGRCIDPLSDRLFCGAIASCTGADAGAACAAGEVCGDGLCAVSCPAGQLDCGGRCIDPLDSRTFCGAKDSCTGADAGAVCAAGEVCAAGVCAVSCPAGQLECGGRCIDPLESRTFCGAKNRCTGADAGAVCADGEVCEAGLCAVSCPAGQLECEGRCVDPLMDRGHCGATGTCAGAEAGATCGEGELCAAGVCVVTCPAGFLHCADACIDPGSHPAFCGASADCQGAAAGAACAVGEVCSSGLCLSNDATLSALSLSAGTLSPAFDPGTTLYVASVSGFVDSLTVTPTAASAGASLTVNGAAVASGSPSVSIPLAAGGLTSITVRVTAPAGGFLNYGVVAIRGDATSAYLKASNTGAGDRFGQAVALSGDTLAIGANGESSNATGVGGLQSDNSALVSGAVYVFTRFGAGWRQEAYLKASNTEMGDYFGLSLALSGDTLAVGAPREDSATGAEADNGAADSGAVYIFTRVAGSWGQRAYLKASLPEARDYFGHSVALSGDLLAVGAPGEDSAATGVGGNQADVGALQSGAAYVFVRTPTGWGQQAFLKASNTGTNDNFGHAVAVSEGTVAVGANNEDSSATGVDGDAANDDALDSGAVYVFARAGRFWTQQAYLKASNTEGLDGFGQSVALSGDTLVVGAPGEDSGATGVGGDQSDAGALESGAGYVFTGTAGVWKQQAYLKASNTGANDRFGFSVALSGDNVAVGAPGEASSASGVNGDQTDEGATSSGAAYLFTRVAGAWSQQAYLKASNAALGDGFGEAVALSGDSVATGAPTEDSSAVGINGDQSDNRASSSGAVYVWTP